MAKPEVEEPVVQTNNTLDRWEKKFDENKKSYTLIGGIIVLVVLLYFAWVKFYIGPKESKAREEMFRAERYFENDSLDKALDGGIEGVGFQRIVDEFGFTSSGNLANYYMGITLLKKGEYEQAIEYLQDFDSDDEIVAPIAQGAIGDAYAQLGELDKAIDQYLKAADMKENNFTSPIYLMRAGILQEEAGKLDQAIETYTKLKEKYPESTEGREVEKYLARANTLKGAS